MKNISFVWLQILFFSHTLCFSSWHKIFHWKLSMPTASFLLKKKKICGKSPLPEREKFFTVWFYFYMTAIYFLFLSTYNKLINIFVSISNLPSTVLATKKKIVYFFYSHEYHTLVGGETKTHVTVKGLVSNHVSKSQVQIQRRRNHQEKEWSGKNSWSLPITSFFMPKRIRII